MDEEKGQFSAQSSPIREPSFRHTFTMHSPVSSSSPRSSVGTWSPATPNFSHKFRNRVPTQMRRCIPIYLACVSLILLILNADLLTVAVPKSGGPVFKRGGTRTNGGHASVPMAQGFPKKVWQTWKIDPLQFEERDSTTARTWLQKNPDYRYEVLTDTNDMGYVELHFGPGGINRPDIVEMYRSITATIIKADLLRYMVMYAEGGVYADIDVEALKPISRFIPDHRYDENDIDMVIGVEIDQPGFRDHPILGKKSQSFCQWTFMARPRLPVMLQLIENIMSWLDGLAKEQNVPVSQVELDFDQVISGTGPSAFTEAIIKQMNLDRPKGTPEISWDLFHELDESKVVSRVLVLDVEAFAAGQGHSDSGNHNARGALVKHHYHASNWPSRHPRFNHPAYGSVEQCNWDANCVAKWDADTAAFALLNEEEQRNLIAFIQREQQELLERQEAFLKALAQQQVQQPLFEQPALAQEPQAPIAVENHHEPERLPEEVEQNPDAERDSDVERPQVEIAEVERTEVGRTEADRPEVAAEGRPEEHE
ncbi:family 32 glycosyltransferase [Cryphonectria parasitica EP155]|uniref:Family 32 glycosyltransferase n=1 Tax=Cryphonectria parasitica (strain ATCC 38755 / EP155) TaxID=660469 RepID=A0A9P4XY79_CRYP1|nr:family 32 glycosyltransferase [Cryphonectria parasitica EP155]KAF3762970.1 family 32 glycosyltransferase [Cryphonectria parasitica EP155]